MYQMEGYSEKTKKTKSLSWVEHDHALQSLVLKLCMPLLEDEREPNLQLR